MIKMCSGIRMTCWSVQHLLRYWLGTRWTLISPGTSCKSYADLFDGLALCVADFVDSRRPCIVIICTRKVKARYSLMYWPRFLAGSVVYVMIFLGNFIQSHFAFLTFYSHSAKFSWHSSWDLSQDFLYHASCNIWCISNLQAHRHISQCEMLCYMKWQGFKLKTNSILMRTNQGSWIDFFFINLKEFIAVCLKVVRVSTLIRDSSFVKLCVSQPH